MREESYYNILERELPVFFKNLAEDFKLLYFKDVSVGSILSSHGDKVSQYKGKFNKAGIIFWKGAAVYLLTYFAPFSGECRETDSGWIDPAQWAIDNFARFEKLFEKRD